MPLFNDLAADAAEAREAVLALARTSRAFSDPADTYADTHQVVGELLEALRSVEQVPERVAPAHFRHQDKALLNNGDRSSGIFEADAAARALRRVSAFVGRAERALDEASQRAGRIAWHPAPTHDEPAMDPFARDPFDQHPVTPRKGLSL